MNVANREKDEVKRPLKVNAFFPNQGNYSFVKHTIETTNATKMSQKRINEPDGSYNSESRPGFFFIGRLRNPRTFVFGSDERNPVIVLESGLLPLAAPGAIDEGPEGAGVLQVHEALSLGDCEMLPADVSMIVRDKDVAAVSAHRVHLNYLHYGVSLLLLPYELIQKYINYGLTDVLVTCDAVQILHQRGVTQQTGASLELVASDVLDHYRTYSLLERLLHNPPKLEEQLAFQIEPQTRKLLIEKYYEFDNAVIRELLGKKLSSRHRKDLDEVGEKTGILLKSCRRQFDNVKRVFKVVEEMQGSVVQNIRNNFLLSEDLAKRYGAVVFIACMRFETSKRKLHYLTFPDFYNCARAMMSGWTYGENSPEFDDTDLDREFLLDLRDVRILLDKEKEHKHLVCQRLKPQLLERSYQELENNFRSYSRALVGVACNLHRTREMRFLFLELVERCLEPWRQVTWSHTDLRNFLTAYMQCALEMDVLREADLKSAWERFMTVVSICLLRMYHT
uniref:Acidic fibroblast growth factor intracellular-binding protein n=1 Tax=Timema genevievae TaxID=629358 RepID=A0A7R9JWW3_TIMGE|nr:unnamed protein product [Timema genevievae]